MPQARFNKNDWILRDDRQEHHRTLFVAALWLLVSLVGVFMGSLWLNELPLLGTYFLSDDRSLRRIAFAAYLISIALAMTLALYQTWENTQLWHFALLWISVVALITLSKHIYVSTLVTLMIVIPFWPGHPFMLIGDIVADTGEETFIIAALCFTALDVLPMRITQILTLTVMGTCVLLASYTEYKDPNATLPRVEEITFDQPLVGHRAEERAILAHVENGDTIITGENLSRHQTLRSDLAFWCPEVERKSLTLFLGVENEDGAGQMMRLSPQRCLTPELVYDPEVGIPSISGGLGDGTQVKTRISDYKVGWLACYEALSIFRWFSRDLRQSDLIIAYANDQWITSFPATQYRRHIAEKMARIFGKEIVFADRG